MVIAPAIQAQGAVWIPSRKLDRPILLGLCQTPGPGYGMSSRNFPKSLWVWGETQTPVSPESMLKEVAQSCHPLEKSAPCASNLDTRGQERGVRDPGA